MKTKWKKLLSFMLVLTIISSCFKFSVYAQEIEEQGHLNWDGITTEFYYVGYNYTVTFLLKDHWDGGYNINVRIENTGNTIIDNWMLETEYDGTIFNIWNAVIDKQKDNYYLLKNVIWNRDIEVGDSVEFGFSSNESFIGFPKDVKLVGEFVITNSNNYDIAYCLDQDYGSEFLSTISITNNSDSILEDWILEFDYDRDITSIWNGEIRSHEGNHYIIKNSGYNSNINAKETISFSFKGIGGTGEDLPFNCTLYSSLINNTEVELTIDTDKFVLNEVTDIYHVRDVVSTLSGTLSGENSVSELSYCISDFKGNIVKEGKIEIGEKWILNDFGLSIGYNKLTIIAKTKNGKIISKTISFMNDNINNINQINVDLLDNDSDGLSNYYELLLGTDPNEADTDGDGLTDYEEFILVGTDPTLRDTDHNEIEDGQEDFDDDGLNSLEEMKYGTNVFNKDTDNDGLSDKDEIFTYFTDPLIIDTDGDGLSDYEDVALNFNPKNPDTDKNGILDGDEKVYQTYSKQIDNMNNPGITCVEIGMECDGLIENKAVIIDTYNIDMLSSNVVGLIGVPVEVSVDADFTTANLVFHYDETALGNSSEDDLVMMWYDKTNNQYVILEDSIVDTENNTVSYVTTHFSTYLIVDKEIWLDAMRMDLNYRSSDNVIYYDMSFVVDVSGSMRGSRITTAKTALNCFIDAMMEDDRAGIVKFNSYATTELNLTNNKKLLKSKVNNLSSSGSTNANSGLLAGIEMLKKSDISKEKMIILICDGDVNYVSNTIKQAREMGIKIHCINVVSGSSNAMQKIANETGGLYYYAATSDAIKKAIEDLTGDTINSVDMTDTDGDGLYDVFETNGMRLCNGQIVYTDPNKADTDGDGINDFDAMGGLPAVETFMLNGNAYSCTLNHPKVYNNLSSEFIYVDGTLNADGRQYFGGISYIPYSNQFVEDKYQKDKTVTMFGETRVAKGAAGVHNLFWDKFKDISYPDYLGYLEFNSLVRLGISLSTLDPTAYDVFDVYANGKGGDEEALSEGYSRKTINAEKYINNPWSFDNSAYDYYTTNIFKTKAAVESVLNDYNQEVYLSISPNTVWHGCDYVNYSNVDWNSALHNSWVVLNNTAAFGTFNSADAGITVNCTYDPETETYFMTSCYYLIDYYDFSFLDILYDQDKLGMAKSFELYGYWYQCYTWKKGESVMHFIDLV